VVATLDDLTVTKTSRMGYSSFEFEVPISFANKHVGDVVVGIDAAEVTRSRIQAQKRISVVTLVSLLCGIAGTLLLSRVFTRPIIHLAEGVARVRAGDHRVSVPVTSRDELGELSRVFNAMARIIREQNDNISDYTESLERSYGDIVRILAAALDARDNYTYGHSARVAKLSRIVGKNLGLPDDSLKELEMACMLHDVGKINVPDSILKKQGPLDSSEYAQIKDHPVFGSEILQLADSLHRYIPAVRHHHEWYDGKGYPDRLAGEEIPLSAQILAIADAYDAMTSSRPYRKARSRDDAVAEIRARKGRQFEPGLAETLISSLDEYEATKDQLRLDSET
jgi:HD-GYP domain-containing protein (c-di-GMP phosphodiesterase class II)